MGVCVLGVFGCVWVWVCVYKFFVPLTVHHPPYKTKKVKNKTGEFEEQSLILRKSGIKEN